MALRCRRSRLDAMLTYPAGRDLLENSQRYGRLPDILRAQREAVHGRSVEGGKIRIGDDLLGQNAARALLEGDAFRPSITW